MATDPSSTRFEKLFDAMDTDHDGTLKAGTFQTLVRRLGRSGGMQKSNLEQSYHEFWTELMRHHGDGGYSLSKQQFVQALQALAKDTSTRGLIERMSNTVFDMANTGFEDKLSKDEFVRFFKAAGGSDDAAALAAFTELDYDGNGAISRADFNRGMKTYMFAPASSTNSSIVFGAV